MPILGVKPNNLLNNLKYEFDEFGYYLNVQLYSTLIDVESTLDIIEPFVLYMYEKLSRVQYFATKKKLRQDFNCVALVVPEVCM